MTKDFHPLTIAPPHARLWRRGLAKRYGDVPRSHAELVWLLGLSGRASYMLNGGLLTFGRGGLLRAPAGSAHMLVSDSDGFDAIVLVSHPALWGAEPPAAQSGAGSGLAHVSSDDLAELEQLARSVVDTDGSAQGPGLQWLLLRFQAIWERSASQGGTALHPAVARAATILQNDPSSDLSALPKAVGLGRGRLAELFRQQMSETLGRFRARQRLLAADRAVAEGQGLLTAALEVGYGSYPQFYRDFRALRGASPRSWYQINRAELQQKTGAQERPFHSC